MQFAQWANVSKGNIQNINLYNLLQSVNFALLVFMDLIMALLQ